MIKQTGFTLIELMVSVAIVGILASVSYPSYRAHIDATNRNENCKIPLLEIAVEMESFRAVNQTYPTSGLLSTTSIPYDASKGDYTFNISASTASSYTLECKNSTDKECGKLTYTNFGKKGQAGTASLSVEECWH